MASITAGTKERQEAQQLFNEKIASGTMTKEELERTPTSLRHFDEAEDAILGLLDEESDEEGS